MRRVCPTALADRLAPPAEHWSGFVWRLRHARLGMVMAHGGLWSRSGETAPQLVVVSGDLAGTSDELAAVNSGLDKLKEMCVAKAEPYAEKKARREAEIAGLKEALQILESEAALVQTSSRHVLRGTKRHF